MKILKKTLKDIYNTETDSQLLDLPDISQTEDDNIYNPKETHMCNLPNQITPEEEITALKTKVAVLRKFILEHFYVKKISMEDLTNKHHKHTPDESPVDASFKEEIDYLREEKKIKQKL